MQTSGDATYDYRIEKARLSVALTMMGGDELRGHIFVHRLAHHGFGTEAPADLFNAPEPFFPLELENGEVILVAKERVAEVVCGEQTPEEAAYQLASRMALVQVMLAGGSVRFGAVRLELPADRPRLIDYLNRVTDRFLTLFTSDEARLINRTLIDRVRPLD
jgi:hypothetical protein